MKLTRISKIRVNFLDVNFLTRKFSWALISYNKVWFYIIMREYAVECVG